MNLQEIVLAHLPHAFSHHIGQLFEGAEVSAAALRPIGQDRLHLFKVTVVGTGNTVFQLTVFPHQPQGIVCSVTCILSHDVAGAVTGEGTGLPVEEPQGISKSNAFVADGDGLQLGGNKNKSAHEENLENEDRCGHFSPRADTGIKDKAGQTQQKQCQKYHQQGTEKLEFGLYHVLNRIFWCFPMTTLLTDGPDLYYLSAAACG